MRNNRSLVMTLTVGLSTPRIFCKKLMTSTNFVIPHPEDIRKRETLRDDAGEIMSDLTRKGNIGEASEVVFNSQVEGQLR